MKNPRLFEDLLVLEILDIRQRVADGYSYEEVANLFQTNYYVIRRLINGKSKKTPPDFKPWEPQCMTLEEYEYWKELRNKSPKEYVRAHREAWTPRPCDDCPKKFARQMRKEGRCNGSLPGEIAPSSILSDMRKRTASSRKR